MLVPRQWPRPLRKSLKSPNQNKQSMKLSLFQHRGYFGECQVGRGSSSVARELGNRPVGAAATRQNLRVGKTARSMTKAWRRASGLAEDERGFAMAFWRSLVWPLGLLSLLLIVTACNVNYNYSEGYGKANIDVTPLPGLPETATVVSVAFSDANHGWAAVANCPSGASAACRGLMFRSSDGGQHWASALPSVLTPRKVQFADPTNGWLIGSIGQNCGAQVCPNEIMMSTDGGKEWDRASGVNVDLLDLGIESASDVWVLGRLCPQPTTCHATLATTESAGQLWANQDIPLKGRDFALQRLDAQTAWVVALASSDQTVPPTQPQLAGTVDGGKSWTGANSPCPGNEQGIDFRSSSDGWLLCRADTGIQVYATANGAKAWQPIGLIESTASASTTAGRPVAGMTRLSDQVGVAALVDGTVAVTRDGGKSWKQELHATGALQGIEHSGANDVWVVGTRQVYRSVDEGQTWTAENFDYHPSG